MTNSDSIVQRNEKMMNHYIGKLKELSEWLFYERSTMMMDFYGRAFDRYPEAAEILGGSPSYRILSPTVCIVFREASFVLDSDISEADALDGLWVQLHALVTTQRNQFILADMAEVHSAVRRKVNVCQFEIVSVIPEWFELLNNRYDEAAQFADDVIAKTQQRLMEAVKFYPRHTTLSKIG